MIYKRNWGVKYIPLSTFLLKITVTTILPMDKQTWPVIFRFSIFCFEYYTTYSKSKLTVHDKDIEMND